jgi:hypothetical protein
VFGMVRDVHKTYNVWKASEAYKLQMLDEHESEVTVTPMDAQTVKVEKKIKK